MAVLVTDPRLEEQLIEQRRASGADHHDEVWEGIYMMAPLPNSEHQRIVARLVSVLAEVVAWPGLGDVFPGVNLTGVAEDWQHDFRVPDVAVFLNDGPGENCDTHWRGGADFLVEITSPGDRTAEKIPFYGRIGVKELLVVDRQPWRLGLYRGREGRMEKVGQSVPDQGETLASEAVGLQFRLVAADPRPQIEVTHRATGRVWLV
ncbi:MAG TPA: Uma2 family endonuclease [Thermoguttaceae bacterium]|nr:Uma2 family endonuclease [Thermoguttaceae bacterium]